ncbi:MAG: hypothetical protein LQ338_007316, partial [Usnochroma carphineum]
MALFKFRKGKQRQQREAVLRDWLASPDDAIARLIPYPSTNEVVDQRQLETEILACGNKKPLYVSFTCLPSQNKMSKADFLNSFPYDEMFTVLIGPNQERFNIHKGLACEHRFFKAALEGSFAESDGTISLPEQDPAIFRWFVYWLYTGSLSGHYYPLESTPSMASLRQEADRELDANAHMPLDCVGNILRTDASAMYELARYQDCPFDKLIGLYILADYLQVPALQNKVIDWLIDTYGFFAESNAEDQPQPFWALTGTGRPYWLPHPVPCINVAWDMLPAESHLCRLLVVLFCDNTFSKAATIQEREHLNPDFLTAALAEAQHRWFSGRSQPD